MTKTAEVLDFSLYKPPQEKPTTKQIDIAAGKVVEILPNNEDAFTDIARIHCDNVYYKRNHYKLEKKILSLKRQQLDFLIMVLDKYIPSAKTNNQIHKLQDLQMIYQWSKDALQKLNNK